MSGLLSDLIKVPEDVVGGVQHVARGAAKVTNPVIEPHPEQLKHAEIVRAEAEKVGINQAYLWGVFGTESSYGTNNAKGGPFQFEPPTAKQYGYPLGVNEGSSITDLKAFEKQAEVAAKYLKALGINKNPQAALEEYNSGKAGGDAAYYKKVVAHAHSLPAQFATAEQNQKETQAVESNPWSPQGGAWGKLLEIGLTLILILAGAALLVYGIAVAVRPRDRALGVPNSLKFVPVG